jgi:adenosine deaminase
MSANGATADDIWRAVEVLELDEVQHGIAAATSPAIMQLADHGIRLNVYPPRTCRARRDRDASDPEV